MSEQSGSTRRDFLEDDDGGCRGQRPRGVERHPRRARAGQRRDPHRPDRRRRPRQRRRGRRVQGARDGRPPGRRRRHVRRPHGAGRQAAVGAVRRARNGEAGARVHRLRRVPEGARRARGELRDPRVAAGIPADAPRGRDPRRQEHLHREAGGRRRPGHPQGDGAGQGGRRQGPQHRRRHAAPAPARLHRDDEARARRRHRRRRRHAGVLEPGLPLEARSPAGVERHGVAAAQLAVLHVALRRPHRRAAHPQHRRDQLGQAGAPGRSAIGMGGRQVRTDKAYGHIFDHFAIDYEYPDGSH